MIMVFEIREVANNDLFVFVKKILCIIIYKSDLATHRSRFLLAKQFLFVFKN